MPDALYRLAYDASIDDAVETAWRLANRTAAFQKQVRQYVLVVSVGLGLVLSATWAYFGSARTVSQLALALLAGVLAGVLFGPLFRRELAKQFLKQHRKVVSEQFGHKPTIPSELELRTDALWVRQAGMEMLFPWSGCTGVRDNPNDIEIGFLPGICVVRNRHFASPVERHTFLDTAKRLGGREPS